MWWDTRKLTAPTEVIILEFSKNDDKPEWTKWASSHGVSCMDYDLSIPVRFMVRLIIFFIYIQSKHLIGLRKVQVTLIINNIQNIKI